MTLVEQKRGKEAMELMQSVKGPELIPISAAIHHLLQRGLIRVMRDEEKRSKALRQQITRLNKEFRGSVSASALSSLTAKVTS